MNKKQYDQAMKVLRKIQQAVEAAVGIVENKSKPIAPGSTKPLTSKELEKEMSWWTERINSAMQQNQRKENMSGIQRYTLSIGSGDHGPCIVETTDNPDGRYMRADDVEEKIAELKEERKQDCIDFFYWWWNQLGQNTDQGYDKWLEQKNRRYRNERPAREDKRLS